MANRKNECSGVRRESHSAGFPILSESEDGIPAPVITILHIHSWIDNASWSSKLLISS